MTLYAFREAGRGIQDQKGNRMPNGFARAFYMSPEWRKCREGYIKSVGGLCERCAARGLIVVGEEVHHKIRITPENIKDPSVTLNWKNLELLCSSCHKLEHKPVKRWRCDEYGHVEI